jgi:hypothetical protein
MAGEEEKAAQPATEHEAELIKHGQEVSLPDAEARAEEQRWLQEEAAATVKRRAVLLEEYASATAMIKNLQERADQLKKDIYVEMDLLGRNGFEAGDFSAMRTQKSRSSLDNVLLAQKVAKEVLEACKKTTTYWELKCVSLKQ